jgi:hypothetical protein
MKRIVLALSSAILLGSCSKEVIYPAPCVDCKLEFRVDTLVTPGARKVGEYICVPHGKMDYFTIEAQMSEIDKAYTINKVPLIGIEWDSDYWVVFKSIGFRYSLYSPFGYVMNDGTKIPVKDTVFTWAGSDPPTNIVGYIYSPNRPGGIETKYGYYSRKSIFFDDEMIGDTCTIYLKATWNTDLVGERKQIIDSLQIIFE